MRLINASTYKLELFDSPRFTRASPFGRSRGVYGNVKYAILSHTWYPADEEVTFQDMEDISRAKERAGWKKIELSCKQALKDFLNYVWIDTCCIDKTSSAELSEAINSMYQWYRCSFVCYTYLSDVSDLEELERSRWFTRGWPLQELLAPSLVKFYSKEWDYLGTRNCLSREISDITGIDEAYLKYERDVSRASVAQRMSWAANRQTTLSEDTAYSLLGIFNVKMPLLYGEAEDAFMRLQQEIIRINEDQSIFAWDISKKDQVHRTSPNLTGALATSPDWFARSGDIVPCDLGDVWDPPTITSRGLYMQAPIVTFGEKENRMKYLLLKCRRRSDLFNVLAIPIEFGAVNSPRTRNMVCRNDERPLWKVETEKWTKLVEQSKAEKFYIVPDTSDFESHRVYRLHGITLRELPLGFVVGEVHPRKCWIEEEGFFVTDEKSCDKSDICVRLESFLSPSKSLVLKFVLVPWNNSLDDRFSKKLQDVVMCVLPRTTVGFPSSGWQKRIQISGQTLSSRFMESEVLGTKMQVIQIRIT